MNSAEHGSNNELANGHAEPNLTRDPLKACETKSFDCFSSLSTTPIPKASFVSATATCYKNIGKSAGLMDTSLGLKVIEP